MNRVAHPVAAVIVALLVGGGVIAGLAYHIFWRPKLEARVEAELSRPYFAALAAKRYEEAWGYHLKAYRQRYPLPAYRAHWEKVFEQKGNVVRAVFLEASDGYDAPNQRKIVAASERLELERGQLVLDYELRASDSGELRISAGQERTSSGSTSRGFSPSGITGPW